MLRTTQPTERVPKGQLFNQNHQLNSEANKQQLKQQMQFETVAPSMTILQTSKLALHSQNKQNPKSAKEESLFLTKDKNVEPFIKRLFYFTILKISISVEITGFRSELWRWCIFCMDSTRWRPRKPVKQVRVYLSALTGEEDAKGLLMLSQHRQQKLAFCFLSERQKSQRH